MLKWMDFKKLELSFTLKLDLVSYIQSMNFFSPDFLLYLFKSNIQPRTEYAAKFKVMYQ